MELRVKFTFQYKVETMYEKARVNVKVKQGSTFTFTRDLPWSGISLSRKFNVREHVSFMRVNKIEAKARPGKLACKVTVESRSTFTFYAQPSIGCLYFTYRARART